MSPGEQGAPPITPAGQPEHGITTEGVQFASLLSDSQKKTFMSMCFSHLRKRMINHTCPIADS